MHEDAREQKKGMKILREVASMALYFAIALIVALVIRAFLFELVHVDGDSMRPNLYDGQVMFVEKISRYTDAIEAGDIVIVRYPDREGVFVKRVVALGGDTVEVKDGRLYINDVLQQEPYIKEPLMHWDTEKITVPDQSYYVMGDNRNDSTDSRSVGAIAKSEVVGRALFVIWPLGAIHGL